ncbi:Integrator complex subunit 12 [Parelaphostrongylus tenuis]|uniref:Integrator complex subunit 12 n=1 Tax=Parelaphostrongylus tenuis TaxID=148309 RepID=A0AAD5MNT4_PARTN|nr:Integrator complex subunit 12 [Parelaphostrongylus tenuis]
MSEVVGGGRPAGGSNLLAGGLKKKSGSSCPFGDGFYSKITKLLLSKEPSAIKELKECAKMVSSAKLTPSDEFWDSGDEISSLDSPAPSSATVSSSEVRTKKAVGSRIIQLDVVSTAEKRSASKAKVDFPPIPEKKKKGQVVLPPARRSDDSDSDDTKATEKSCKKCAEKTTGLSNSILTCEGCHTSYHQKCHKPEVTMQQTADPRFIFLCSECSNRGTSSEKSRSSSPKLSTKSGTSTQNRGPGLSSKSGPDISATFEAYKRKKERQVMKTKAVLPKHS